MHKLTFSIAGSFYIGGVPQVISNDDGFSRQIASRKGYQGCIGNLVVSNELIDITGKANIATNGTVYNFCEG